MGGLPLTTIASHQAAKRDYFTGRPHLIKTRKFQVMDSLLYKAYARNPFLIQNLDRLLLEEVIYRNLPTSESQSA